MPKPDIGRESRYHTSTRRPC